MKRFLVIAFLLLSPFAAQASADLSIVQSGIRFSSDLMIAGDTIRIYASITNVGDEDVSGYISFYQGSVLVGDSQVISVVAAGNPEEVYVDFVVPSSRFNIQAIIRGTNPEDINESNNVTITPYFKPILDDDRDGVENSEDNCPNIANANQNDNDGDGEGDLCDDDDDNDGLSDEVELELGSSTTSSDTDGDGVLDPNDAFPTDPSRSEIEPEPTPVVEEVVEESGGFGSAGEAEDSNDSSTISELLSEIAVEMIEDIRSSSNDDEETPSEDVPEAVVEEDDLGLSVNAIFTYERVNWNTYTFQVLNPLEGSVRYEWNFGDEVKSSKSEVNHTYTRSGAYTVTLAVSDGSGIISEDSLVVLVPFFSLDNNVVLMAVAGLILLLLIGLGVLFSIAVQDRKRKKR